MAKKSKGAHDVLLRTFEKAVATNFLGSVYTKFFEKMTLEEFAMVDIQPRHRVLHIGCGGVPNTLLILGNHVDASYTGIDRDRAAVRRARAMVERQGLTRRVTIEQGDALTYPLADFDLIVVSLGVEPRERVFARIREEVPGAAVIARKPWDFMDRIYGRDAFIPRGFEVVDVFHRQDFIKSMLLKKTGG
ncbi:MAG: class I SAM-dependent methyltransferase [Candidatus Thermoplasmatota archaeon]|nr:class I SAM-dependent methyltransferase [Candidatus Thermoplasmatota archaeon]MDD5778576.1 class I SAM-dependent methyltransferase [Candidatus Thermoplasmatota archaeon]